MKTKTIGTLLAIDDEEGLRECTCSVSEVLGLNALMAEDGEDTQGILSTQTLDIIVSEMNMPRMDGSTLLSEIRKTWSHPLILFIPAFTSNRYTLKAPSLGAYDYLDSGRIWTRGVYSW